MKPSVLFLTPEVPYPVAGGGPLRSACLLEYLARRYVVDAVVFHEPRTPAPEAEFPAGLVRDLLVLELPCHARHTAARAWRNARRLIERVPPLTDRFSGFGPQLEQWLRGRRYALAVVEHFWCAGYWEQVASHSERTILDLHNVESVLHARCAAVDRWPSSFAHRAFGRAALKGEQKWFANYNLLLVPSEVDAAQVKASAPEAVVAVYPNTIPTVTVAERPEEDVIVFSGNMEYHPNTLAVRYFAERIWPGLRERWPKLVWRLVGKNPEAVRGFLGRDPRIHLTGAVADATEELASAKVVVVPLLSGSGTRLKVIEAWASRRAVVSTSLGVEGLPYQHQENVLVADGATSFADAVSHLLANEEERRRLGQAGRWTYEQQLTWETAWSRLDLLKI